MLASFEQALKARLNGCNIVGPTMLDNCWTVVGQRVQTEQQLANNF